MHFVQGVVFIFFDVEYLFDYKCSFMFFEVSL